MQIYLCCTSRNTEIEEPVAPSIIFNKFKREVIKRDNKCGFFPEIFPEQHVSVIKSSTMRNKRKRAALMHPNVALIVMTHARSI
jgi:hypothetical protein